jgi:hypothetical protein
MGATSVTGTGMGMSNGTYKPENNCGCGCGKEQDPKPPKRKIGCVTRNKSCSTTTVKVGSSTGIKVCS